MRDDDNERPDSHGDDFLSGEGNFLHDIEEGLPESQSPLETDLDLKEGDRRHRIALIKKWATKIITSVVIVSAGVALLWFVLKSCTATNEVAEKTPEPTISENDLSQENLDVPRVSIPPSTSTQPKPPPLSRNERDVGQLAELTVVFVDAYFSGNRDKAAWLGELSKYSSPRLIPELETVNVDLLKTEEPVLETVTPIELGDNTAIMQVATDQNTVARIQAERNGDGWHVNRFSFRLLTR